MGIVSLQSYLFPGYRVRMAGFTVSGKVSLFSLVYLFVHSFVHPGRC